VGIQPLQARIPCASQRRRDRRQAWL